MPAPKNMLKARLTAGETLFGCWLASGQAYMAEIAGRAGFDWCLIDAEHGPNEFRNVLEQMQVLGGLPTEALVRLPWGEDWMVKKALDAGAQSILIPMVESGADAERLVRATKYPPHGHRGVGAAATRATNYGEITDYLTTANDEVCLMVQVESVKGYEALDDILAVEGVDAVFIGPADLSADMGYPGQMGHDEVQKVIKDILTRTAKAGKAPAILSLNDEVTAKFVDWGARFVAVAIDISLLSAALRGKAAHWCGKG